MEVKNPTTYEEQILLLKNYGCNITDEAYAIKMLRQIRYYRLSGYLLPFRDEVTKKYNDGTSFENIIQIYQFDCNLRSIFYSCIDEIEIFLKSNFSYYFSHKYGALGYTIADNFSAKHNHEKFVSKYENEIELHENTLFVQHHKENYDGQFPFWVLIELFSFGMLSIFYSDLKLEDQKEIAKDLYDTIPRKLRSWLYCCTELRNVCSHYYRLYFRTFSGSPNLSLPDDIKTKLWGFTILTKALYPDKEKWNNIVVPRITNLFDLYEENINLQHISFPTDWKHLILN